MVDRLRFYVGISWFECSCLWFCVAVQERCCKAGYRRSVPYYIVYNLGMAALADEALKFESRLNEP